MAEDKRFKSIHYQSYLQLDKILKAQTLRSDEISEHAHDEMLFIVAHQVYELWFKQILHELGSVTDLFSQSKIDEKTLGSAVSRLNRVIEIQKLMIDQVAVLETMTPLDFLEFRHLLFPASGFQSFQFRKVEVLLGLKDHERITYNKIPYDQPFSEEQQGELSKIKENNLLSLAQKWLERTPFLTFKDFDFITNYKSAVEKMLEREYHLIDTAQLDEKEREMRRRALGNTDIYYQQIFEESEHEKRLEAGETKLSYKSTIAALLINLYRDEPILHQPYRLLNSLVEIDEMFTTWRYRHAQMVLRMLGKKIGTGGSSGYEYLRNTAVKHHVFTDFHNISTLLIPRSHLPELPAEVKQTLGFYYSTKS